jgi:hypothetical protein
MMRRLYCASRAAMLRAYREGCRAGRESWRRREPIRCPYWNPGLWLAWQSGYDAGLKL